MKRRASIEKARKILGYEPKTDVGTGLKRTYGGFWRIEVESNRLLASKFLVRVK